MDADRASAQRTSPAQPTECEHEWYDGTGDLRGTRWCRNCGAYPSTARPAQPAPASERWTVKPEDVRDSLVWTTTGPWVSRPHPLDGPMVMLGIDTESTARLITKRVNDRAAALRAQGIEVES